MRRRGLVGFLFGAAASAQAIKPESEGVVLPSFRIKPKNGECPVCGAVAAKIPTQREMGIGRDCHSVPDTPAVIQCDTPPDWMVPSSTVVRCRFCSVSFWQDSEK